MKTKQCTKCLETKPLCEFHNRSSAPDGKTYQCKECNRKRRLDYYYENREEELSRFKEWREENAERKREYDARYYEENAEDIKAQAAEYREENAERKRKYDRQYAKENPEVKRRARRRWAKRNPIKQRVINMRKRKRRMNAEGDYTAGQWEKLIEYYCPDGRCLCCGDKGKLTMDHVVPLADGGNNYISNLQPLCRPCNGGKRDKTIDYRPDGGAFARGLAQGQP